MMGLHMLKQFYYTIKVNGPSKPGLLSGQRTIHSKIMLHYESGKGQIYFLKRLRGKKKKRKEKKKKEKTLSFKLGPIYNQAQVPLHLIVVKVFL